MKALSGKELAKILERHGRGLKRVSGSHHIYTQTDSIVRISVPIHGNKPLKIGLLTHLIKMAGLKESDLE